MIVIEVINLIKIIVLIKMNLFKYELIKIYVLCDLLVNFI